MYRADDLTLDQAVALKFLPPAHQTDPAWFGRFCNEVRLSRQVTHPNVCRVFDLDQVDDQHFISMEFVDGENLASLLRRIGRLPPDKAVQIARQLCAGLAAAHEKGVLHRDLKPANVMLDGRGQVRITDFGISAPMNEQGVAPSSGTPAYMAPEQFRSGQASTLSDIYSLGLVLYEVFTGRQAFSANSVLEYARLHDGTSPTHPSTFVNDIDPLVERVILRCLEKEPTRRPPSALAVAAALPGGDPLAAALAAGETPSPAMVAAAGGDMPMSIVRGGVLLGLTLVGLMAVVLLTPIATLLPRMALSEPPAVLAEKAKQVLETAGYASALPNQAQGFAADASYVAWATKNDQTRSRWDRLASARPGAASFWYRQSPQPMVSRDDFGVVSMDEPARSLPGMRTVVLDPLGRLKRLEILPDGSRGGLDRLTAAVDFAPLFKLAELNFADFAPAEPSAPPPMYADARFAWRGHYPESPRQPITVEGASLGGRCVYFRVLEAWQANADLGQLEVSSSPRSGYVVFQVVMLAVIALGLLLAWYNVREGRGDSAGAHKVSAAFLVLGTLIWLLAANHVPQLSLEIQMFFRVLGFILVPAAIVWMFYLALEPYVRRIWPETVISWNRLLATRLTDPLVASHALIGLAIAVAVTILSELVNLLPMWLGHAAPVPYLASQMRWLSRDNAAATALSALLIALYMGLLYLLLLVLLQLLLRRRWLAAGMFVLAVGALGVQWDDLGIAPCAQSAITAGLILLLLVRYGLVAALAALWAMFLLRNTPLTSDMSIWYSGQSRFAVGLLCVAAMTAATLATRGWRTARSRGAV